MTNSDQSVNMCVTYDNITNLSRVITVVSYRGTAEMRSVLDSTDETVLVSLPQHPRWNLQWGAVVKCWIRHWWHRCHTAWMEATLVQAGEVVG